MAQQGLHDADGREEENLKHVQHCFQAPGAKIPKQRLANKEQLFQKGQVKK